MAEFSLRQMRPDDGAAIDALMRNEPLAGSVAISTHYRHDLYASLLAQYPTLFGIVATAPGFDGLVGFATAYTDEVLVNGAPMPSAHLANLKVHHDVRRQGLGARLAAWRIDEARRRLGSDVVIATDIEASNAGSLATARHWATQLLGPVRIVVARPADRPPRSAGLTYRPMSDAESDAVIDAANAFNADAQLYPPHTRESLAAYLAPTTIGAFRHSRLVTTADGTLVAGAMVTERFQVMEDHFDRVPRPLELISRVLPVIPRDGVLRTVELSLAWYAPGRADAGRFLWDAIRHEWRDRANTVVAQVDPRGPLVDVFRVGPTLVPKLELVAPVLSPVRLDEVRPVYLWR
jgi:predicted N-acetyltransferase YhbS